MHKYFHLEINIVFSACMGNSALLMTMDGKLHHSHTIDANYLILLALHRIWRMLLDKIINTIAVATQRNEEIITADARLDSLGIDSLKAINIVYELEEEFGIEVPNEAIAKLVTVNDIDVAISNLLAER